MKIKQEYLDWSSPALPRVVQWLAARYATEEELDLADVILTLPGSGASRRLAEQLLCYAQENSLAYQPPKLVTPEQLPELFYELQKPIASAFTQQLVWTQATEKLPEEKRKPHGLIVPEDLPGKLALGKLLAALHRELAAENLDCQTVLREGIKLRGFNEQTRWEVLAEIEAHYHTILDTFGLWDLQSARLFAIKNKEPRCEKDIVLVATADLRKQQRLMLDLVADKVTALIFAPASHSEFFDEHGCIIPQKWLDAEIPIPEEAIRLVGSSNDQAFAVAELLSDWTQQENYCGEELVVGAPDPGEVPALSRVLTQTGVTLQGGLMTKSVRETLPYSLLLRLSEHLKQPNFATLAALARQPVLREILREKTGCDPASLLDTLWNTLLPAEITQLDTLVARVTSSLQEEMEQATNQHQWQEQQLTEFQQAHALVITLQEILSPVTFCTEEKVSQEALFSRVLGWLATLYEGEELDRDDPATLPTRTAIRAILTSIEELRKIPEALLVATTPAEALQLLLDEAGSETVPLPPQAGAIEIEGWLELPLSDCRGLVVASFNEGIIPKSRSAHIFLPNNLCKHLQLDNNERRYARDAYALATLLASRERLALVVPRHNVGKEPVIPSRLLFATDDATLASRAERIFGEELDETARRVTLASQVPQRETTLFTALNDKTLSHLLAQKYPERNTVKPITSLSVTGFRDYLECPYRFFLKTQLGLEPCDDAAMELDALQFGSLAHNVVEAYGKSACRDTIDAKEIDTFLQDALSDQLAAKLGERLLPATAVQAEQLRMRLQRFAHWQAAHAATGWQIKWIEASPPQGRVAWKVDDKKFFIRGRIDRIDYNAETESWAVFDYKTTESAKKPDEAHHQTKKGKKVWVDLQLPLYLLLMTGLLDKTEESVLQLYADQKIQLGYILLPKKLDDIKAAFADWSPSLIEDAWEIARCVIRDIRNDIFQPPETWDKSYDDLFATLVGNP